MVVVCKCRGRGVSGKLVEEPFPGGSRDGEELAGRVRNEFFKDMDMMGVGFRRDSYAFSLTPPCPKVSFDV